MNIIGYTPRIITADMNDKEIIMAYEKQTWQCGDVVTADKLNHIEDGLEELSQSGGGSALVANIVADKGSKGQDIKRLDVTAKQLFDAYEQGAVIEYREVEYEEYEGVTCKTFNLYICSSAYYSANEDYFSVVLENKHGIPKPIALEAYSADEYPSDEEREDEGGDNQN